MESPSEKLKIVAALQSKLPELILGGSLGAFAHKLQYRYPNDIDLFSERYSTTDLLCTLDTLGLKLNRSRLSKRISQVWSNGEFKAEIKQGIAVELDSKILIDYKKVQIYSPYSMESEMITVDGINVRVQTQTLLEQGIRAFLNQTLIEGYSGVLSGKYKDIDRVFTNRNKLI